MVATQSHSSRRPSGLGTARNDRISRRRSSLKRRPSDKISSAILQTSARGPTPQQLQIPHQRRARSFSAAPTDATTNAQDRRPSVPLPSTPLSIAERFMNSSYSPSSPSADPRSSTTCASPSPSVLSSSADSQRLSAVDRERSASSLSSSRLLHSPSNLSSPTVAEPDPNRLTIASAFMRSNTADSDTRSSSNVHPLEGQDQGRPLSVGSLNLDLSLPSPVASLHGRNYTRRPWGSQDTLVQRSENKASEDKTGGLDAYPDEKDETEEDEEEGEEAVHEIDLDDEEKGHSRGRRHDDDDEDDDNSGPRGCWIGCCFVSWGRRRPSPRALAHASEDGLSLRNCGRRGWVICTFLTLILAITTGYFLWPRTPLMRIEGATLTSGPKISQTGQGTMVGNVAFESDWLVNITVDNRQNHVPTRLVGIHVVAKDALTGLVLGKGLHNDDASPADAFWLPANAISTIQLPITVNYQAREASDTTFDNLRKACVPQQPPPPPPAPTPPPASANHTLAHNATISSPPPPAPTIQRESLPLHFWITLRIWGLEYFNYKPTLIAAPANGGFACPLP